LALTTPTSGGCSVGIVRFRTQATEFVFVCLFQKDEDISSKGLRLIPDVCIDKQNKMFVEKHPA
jgi:hypothetical protein